MNKTIVVFLSIISFTGFRFTEAQQPVSLYDLVNRALEENYQIRIARSREEIASNNNTIGNAGFLPSADLSAEQAYAVENSRSDYYTGVTRSGTNAKSTSFNAMAEVNWVIFDGFRMFAAKDRLVNLQESGRLETRYYIEQTVSDIAKAYYNLVEQRELLSNYRQSLEISAYRVKLEQEKLRLGSGNALLYHQALVDYNADSVTVVNQKMIIRNIEIQINTIVNQDPETTILPADKDILIYEIGEKDSLVASALERNIDLKQSQIEELIAETNRRTEAADRYPEISLFGNYSYSRQTSELGFVESARSYGPQYGIRVRFNLFDGGRETQQLRNARIEEDISETDKNRTSQMILAGLTTSLNQHNSFTEQVNLITESLGSAERSLQIAKQQLEYGAINGYDFRVTQRTYIEVKNHLVALKFSLVNAEIDILRISATLMPAIM